MFRRQRLYQNRSAGGVERSMSMKDAQRAGSVIGASLRTAGKGLGVGPRMDVGGGYQLSREEQSGGGRRYRTAANLQLRDAFTPSQHPA